MTTVQPERYGKYRISRLIGRGGMGTVWLADDPDLGRQVAVKVLPAEHVRQGNAADRFANEARALAALRDQHIVQVHEYVPGPEPFLVMEFVRGRSLNRILHDRGPRPSAEVAEAARQSLKGLRAAHSAGILHRDIKPGNILLGDDGIYRLADFGLARRIGEDEELTRTGEVVGTARYLAPELAQGGEHSPTSDLYALGVTLVELAAGINPRVTDGNPLRLLRRIAEEPLPPIRSLLPAMPERLASWLDRMVAHDPRQRFASAGEALAALGAAPPAATPSRPTAASGESGAATAPTGILPTAPTAIATPQQISATHRPTPSGEIRSTHSSRNLALTALLRPWRLGLLPKLILAIWLVAFAATALSAWVIIRRAGEEALQRLRHDLRTSAAAAALLIDGDQHAALVAAPSRENPAYAQVLRALVAFRDTRNDISHIYTVSPLPETPRTGVVQLLCDAAEEKDANGNGVIDPDEEAADPGERFDAKTCPEMIRGFTQPAVDEAPTRDQWGFWLSGYAPIRDREGRITGLVGLDIAASRVDHLLDGFLRDAWLLLAGTLVLALAISAFIADRLRRPVEKLRRGMLALARGERAVTVDVRSGDEFQGLAVAFNQMAGELQDAAQLRTAFDRVLVRAIGEQLGGASSSSAPVAGHAALLHAELDVEDGQQRLRVAGQLPLLLPRLIDAVRQHDGRLDRVAGCGMLAIFPAAGPDDHPQGRVLLAALAMLTAASAAGVRLRIGVADDRSAALAEERAALLCRANRDQGTDLLIEAGAFAPVADRFYADRLANAVVDCYAVKGEVAAKPG